MGKKGEIKMRKLLLGVGILLSASLLSASLVREMGLIPIKHPKFDKELQNKKDINLFIDELSETIYYAFGDGVLKASRKYRERSRVGYKDIVYMGVTLIPNRKIDKELEAFYNKKDSASLAKVAKENGVSHMIFADFNEELLNKALTKNKNYIQFPLTIYIYDVEDNKLLKESLKIGFDKKDFDFDPDALSMEIKQGIDRIFNTIYKGL